MRYSQSLNKILENSFHVVLMDSYIFMNARFTFENLLHRTYLYVLCASGEQSNEKIGASGYSLLTFLASI